MTNKELLEVSNRILKNIDHRGLKRYDRIDIKWNPKFYFHGKYHKFRKLLLVLEEFFPYTIRKVFHVEKKILPNTFTFIINALFFFEKNHIKINSQKNSVQYMEMCMKKYLTVENQIPWWNYPKEIYSHIVPEFNKKRPTMHMYGLARIGRLLLDLGKYYEKKEWIELSYNTLIQTIKQHNVYCIKDKVYISYFYNSDDYIINANTEVAFWIAQVSMSYPNENLLNEMLLGIIRMILDEQNDDGSWYYYAKISMDKYKIDSNIDCHHTGTVLFDLVSILALKVLPSNVQDDLIKAVDLGMKYYIKAFFANPNHVRSFIGLKRPAGVTQYSEALYAFYEYLKYKEIFNKDNCKLIQNIIPTILNKNIKLIQKDGSAKGEKVIKWVNIDSIRWGNGPVLESISRYFDYLKLDFSE